MFKRHIVLSIMPFSELVESIKVEFYGYLEKVVLGMES